MELSDHLWLPFLDQPKSDVLVFDIINIYINIIVVTKWKYAILTNDLIQFNEELEVLSTSIIELVNID